MAGLLESIGGWLSDDTNSVRLAGIGQVLSAMDQGQVADVSPFLQAIDSKKQDAAFKQQMQDGDHLGKFSADERTFLSTLPPQIAQQFIAERIFAQPDPWANTKVVGDKIVTMGANGPQVLGDYGSQDPWAGTKVIGDQVVTMGPNGPQVLGNFGADKTARPLTDPQERAAWGIPPEDMRPYAVEPGKAPALVGDSKGVTVNNNMGGDKFDEAWAKSDADTVASLSDAGMAAMRNQPRINQLDALLAQNPTGGMANLKLLAGEWGLPTDGVDELQTARAIISAMVPEQRQPGSGPMSDADLELFKQSLPRIINQPGGNRLIIDTLRAISQYDADGARIIQQGRSGQLNRAQMFEALQARQNPLAKFVAPSQARQDQVEGSWSDIGNGVKIRRKE